MIVSLVSSLLVVCCIMIAHFFTEQNIGGVALREPDLPKIGDL